MSPTVPMPAACPGWYVADETGARVGYTSDPAQAKQVLAVACTLCGTTHVAPEGSCLL